MKNLIFPNNFGGFIPDSGDYVINQQRTPIPWCNIIANPQFGTLITQSGASHTWYGNSSLFRISPKIDDSLLEQSGEKLFLKNESNGKIWQPLASASEVKHAIGYSVFRSENDLNSEISIFVTQNKPLKVIQIKLKNNHKHSINFSATYYMQPVLGEFLERTKADIQTFYDSKSKLVYIRNPGSFYYPEALVYLGVSESNVSYSLNRAEFLGRNNQINPIGLKTKKLSSKNIPANDPAAVIRTDFILKKNEEKTIYFYIGVDKKNVEIKKPLIVDSIMVNRELNAVKYFWKNLPVFEIDTPNNALNLMVNHRLLYQVLSSRLWGKTGFWQPGGAFGFRDQLQDSMALIWSDPQIVKNQILLSSSRQFTGGDVQHWWHPPRGDGIRTTSSDAGLWLVYVLNYYLDITGDKDILDEQIPFLDSNSNDHPPGSYFVPKSTNKTDTLYKHCILAMDRCLGLTGSHGLPLIFSGDWNDSLSKIGVGKKGESIWLAQFLGKVLKDFIPICKSRSDVKKVDEYSKMVANLESSLEKSWDGDWYKRAYWDDGVALGSVSDKYCRIDSLTQNWSVISGMGSKARSITAMNSLEKNLIDWDRGDVRLLAPSFVEDPIRDPGYIVTYPPGTRENGSTYSHNACWTALAFAILGEGQKAMGVLDIINPILRTDTEKKANLYKGEPYAMAGDIYSEGSNHGQAGWTWYTGSASVYYKTVIQNILGITIKKNKITFSPNVPSYWNSFSVKYRYGQTIYNLNYENPNSAESGVKQVIYEEKDVLEIILVNDNKTHNVTIIMS